MGWYKSLYTLLIYATASKHSHVAHQTVDYGDSQLHFLVVHVSVVITLCHVTAVELADVCLHMFLLMSFGSHQNVLCCIDQTCDSSLNF